MEPNFLIVRFTHGSGGKFLSTVLQTSNAIDHWEPIIQQKKNTSIFRLLNQEYVSRKFPRDNREHLKNEPMVPYNTDLYSTSYNRGKNVTLSQYLANAKAKNDTRLTNAIESALRINLIMHQPDMPVFCQGADSVMIVIDNDRSLEWLNRTLWSKHFLEVEDWILYLPDHPEYCSFNSLSKVLQYENPYQFPKSQKSRLWQEKIINNHTRQKYFNPKNFQTESGKIYFFPLSSLLSTGSFLDHICKIFVFFGLGDPDLELVESLHHTWLSRQIQY